ncbi:GNAT family N-acetyltransferase [Paenibacillus donghaensis]|uniref:GNAT family N-acetyltransferase n=1 Tax=Paenibacillus donghaensis TaxID=414771 RepID=A0A2Z2KTD7_9BACL|nr:GNAT family protein [Paenibacillus donghaensis]ASA25072.1 GNAT family N-acetyltransferase [Paenibacillus donghaensis]
MQLTFYNHLQGIYIAPLELKDAGSLLRLRVENRSSHQRYEPLREEDYYTLASQEELIRQRMSDAEQDRGYMFGIFLLEGELIGQITLSNIVRGVGQFADLGYVMDQRHQGNGYMSAAVALALDFAFRALALHRVQAAILLHNDASRRVLEKNGFQAEGIARRFIRINGGWQDHRTYAILADDI